MLINQQNLLANHKNFYILYLMNIQYVEPDRNVFLIQKIEEMWDQNKLLFLCGFTIIVAVVIAIIIVVVLFLVRPSLPHEQIKFGPWIHPLSD